MKIPDDQIRKNREELLDRLPPDCRTDAANRHIEALHVVERIIGGLVRDRYSLAYHSFLDGWDAAMRVRSEELLEEHMELHAQIAETEIAKLKKERGEL